MVASKAEGQSRSSDTLLSRGLFRDEEQRQGKRLRDARDEMRSRVVETELGRALVLRRLSSRDACEHCGELIRLGQHNQAMAEGATRGSDAPSLGPPGLAEGRDAITRVLDGDAGLQRMLDATVVEWSDWVERLPEPADGRPRVLAGSVPRRLRHRVVFGRLVRVARAVAEARRRFLLARERFVAANQRLVFHQARRYEGRGLVRDDLVQEGNLGLVKAAEQFDYRLGFRFSTYAVWWIRQALARAVAEQASDIRVPYMQYERFGKVSRATRDFLQAFGREPTFEELADRTDLSARQVKTTLGAGRAVASLQQPAGETGEQPLANFLADPQAASPCEQAERRELSEQLMLLVDELPEREADILRLRFGMNGQREHTLEEIGRLYELTRERIRQLEARALRRLRGPNQRRLLDCLEPES